MRNISLLGFGATYVRGLTVYHSLAQKYCRLLKFNLKKSPFYFISIMAASGLATPGARASVVMYEFRMFGIFHYLFKKG